MNYSADTKRYIVKSNLRDENDIGILRLSDLQDYSTSDDLTQYALLNGRDGGQHLYGGTDSSENLTLESTYNSTKGNIILNSDTVINSGYVLKLSDGIVSLPSYTFNNETSSGLYRIGAGNIGLSILGTKRLDITSSMSTFATAMDICGNVRIEAGNSLSIGVTTALSVIDAVGTNGLFLCQNSITNSIAKFGLWGVRHYINTTEEPFYSFFISSTSSLNTLYIGGGSALGNAATSIIFYTAANNITTTGTNVGSFTINGFSTAYQITSTLAIGTSPFAVTSNTVNTNLNSDMLDGYHASSFLQTVTPHALLSATHNDTTVDSPVIGDLLMGNTGPVWTKLADVAVGSVLISGGVGAIPLYSTTLCLGSTLTANTILDITSTHATVPGVLIRSATASADVALSFYHSVATAKYWTFGIDSDATGKPLILSPNSAVHGNTDYMFKTTDVGAQLCIGNCPTSEAFAIYRTYAGDDGFLAQNNSTDATARAYIKLQCGSQYAGMYQYSQNNSYAGVAGATLFVAALSGGFFITTGSVTHPPIYFAPGGNTCFDISYVTGSTQKINLATGTFFSDHVQIDTNVTTSSNERGIYWHGTTTDAWGIYRTAGAWSAPYVQLKMSFATGIILNPGHLYGKSYVMIEDGDLIIGNDSNGTTIGLLKFGTGLDAGIGYDGTHFQFYSQLIGTGHFVFNGGSVGIGGTPVAGTVLDMYGVSPVVQLTPTTATQYATHQIVNGGNTLRMGIESSAGGALLASAAAYSGIINCYSARNLHFGTGNVIRMTIAAAGAIDTTGTFTVATAFGCNGKTAQAAYTVNAACTDLPTVVALCNQLRAALVANGVAV